MLPDTQLGNASAEIKILRKSLYNTFLNQKQFKGKSFSSSLCEQNRQDFSFWKPLHLYKWDGQTWNLPDYSTFYISIKLRENIVILIHNKMRHGVFLSSEEVGFFSLSCFSIKKSANFFGRSVGRSKLTKNV